MMKKVFAILALAASLAACARMEQPVDETPEGTTEVTEPPTTYTLTVKATKDAGTRALALVTDEETHRQTLNATWAEGETIIVYKEEPSPFPSVPGIPRRIGTLNPTDIRDDGQSCTLEGELEAEAVDAVGGISSGDELQLLFPGSLGAADGDDHPQDGTLETIQDYHDLAYAVAYVKGVDNGSFSADDGKGGAVAFTNGQAVVRFVLRDKEGNAITPGSVSVTVTHEGMQPDEPITFSDFADTYTDNGGCFFLSLKGLETYDFSGSISLTATDGDFTYTYAKAGITFTAGKYYSIAVKKSRIVDFSKVGIDDGDIFMAQDGDILTGTVPGVDWQIEIADGATVTLRNMQHEATSSPHDGITCEGDATIVLEGDNTVKGGDEGAGVYVPEGKTLIIKGNGSLVASAGSEPAAGAGIGSTSSGDGGNIVIESGEITAIGSPHAAGIGAAQDRQCGDITIMGGTVTANGTNAACIGGAPGAECGDITISGGKVIAEFLDSYTYVGIGGCSSCGDITISGGEVTAHSSVGIGINGGSPDDNCGNITISKGTVVATGTDGCGIGAQNGRCGEITISGGSVTATGGNNAAGIGTGGGEGTTCGTITITDGATYVEATKGNSGDISQYNCIGAGFGCQPVDVSIDGVTDFLETTTDIGCFHATLSNNNRTWVLNNTNN